MNEEELKISILDEVLSKERTKDKLKIEEIIRIEPITSPEIRGWLYEAICLGFQKGKLEERERILKIVLRLKKDNLDNPIYVPEFIKQLQKEIGDDNQQPRMKQTRGGELKSDEGLHSTDNGSPADTLKLNHKCPICDKDIYLRDDTVNEKGVIYHLGCYLFENHFTINDSLKDIWDNSEDDRWDKEYNPNLLPETLKNKEEVK